MCKDYLKVEFALKDHMTRYDSTACVNKLLGNTHVGKKVEDDLTKH